MSKATDNKATYIMEQKLQELNNRLAREFYHNLLNEILEPILQIEHTFLNPQLYECYQLEDFQGMLKELIIEIKKIKFTKYNPLSMEEYLSQLEEELKTA